MNQFTFFFLVLCSRAVLGRVLVCHEVSSREELLRLTSLLSDKYEGNSSVAEYTSTLHVPESEYALDSLNVTSVESATKNASLESGNWIFMTPSPGRSKIVNSASGAANETVGVQYSHENVTETAGVEYADEKTTPIINGSNSLEVDNTTAFSLNEEEHPETTTAGATTRLFWNLLNPTLLGSNPVFPQNGLLPPLPAPAPLPLPALRPAAMSPPLVGYNSLVNNSNSAASFHAIGASKGAGLKQTGNGPYEPPLSEEDSSEDRVKDRRNSDTVYSAYRFPLALPHTKEKSRMQPSPTATPTKKISLGNKHRYQYFRPSH